MTRILCEPHLKCENCRLWQFCLHYMSHGADYYIGVCACSESDHHGHTLAGDHQGCGHMQKLRSVTQSQGKDEP